MESNQTNSISHEITLFAEPIFHFKNFTVTNSLLTSTFAVLLIAILSVMLRSKLREVPGKLQNIFEILVEGALSLCDQVTNDREISIKVFPIAISVFFFVLINNWLGLLPIGGLGFVETRGSASAFIPFLRGGTADVNTTIALAIMAVVGANLFGILSIGAWKTFNKY